MRQQTFQRVPFWSDGVLERGRRRAIELFITERMAEGGQRYRDALNANLAVVNDLFTATNDLLEFASGIALAENPSRINIARYLSGPPVSADDLDTLADASIVDRRRLEIDLARRAAQIITATMDRERFPWLFEPERRGPTPSERHAALVWTAGLQTVQQIQTSRRGESSARQEAAVQSLLSQAGFTLVTRRPITIVGGIDRGEYCRESLVEGIKCDIPICLRDGRFLFIECKVSNSALNSVKRLNREVGGKARAWHTAFGDRAITAAVLSGVFRLKNLQDAQTAGVAIFWEHDLFQLQEFVLAAV